MSAGTAPPPAASPVAEPEAPPSASPAGQPDTLPVRVAAFAALLAFSAGHWAALVSDPPAFRVAALVVFLTAGGVALAWLGRAPLDRRARTLACAGVALLTVVGGMVLTGLAARLVWPGNWDDLGDLLDRGLSAIHTVSWPLSGGDNATRLVVLLGAPLLGGVAAVLAFWPARRHAGLLRGLALVVLLVMYGTAVTEHELSKPLLRGMVLLFLLAAWLWLPRLAPREAAVGTATVLVVGFLALPLSAGLDGESPWWDYRSWNWFGGEADVAFDWNHSYGPMNWPREGKTLLNVKTRSPAYLKAETLDRFDGRRWVRSAAGGDGRPGGELPTLTADRWEQSLRVTIRALRSDFVVTTGTPLSVNGADPVTPSADGTVTKLGEPLEKGESYTVRAYVPEPRPGEMRAAEPGSQGPGSSYFSIASRYTGLTLPTTAAPGPGASRPVFVPPRGLPGVDGSQGAADELLQSPYRRAYRLARRLTGTAPTAFDAVRAVERYLERNMRYDEGPPARRFPLEAFLFQDKIGYCQHFSGAMTLLLRMSGIPARVVSGFSPGVRDADKRDEYRIRDLDAHSWVEVYFAGIGWVTFDPTPPVAPAQSQVAGFDLGGRERDAGAAGSSNSRAPRGDTPGDRASPTGGGGGGSGLTSVLVGLVLVGVTAGGALGARHMRAARSLERSDAAEARVRELERALPRLGVSLRPGATLTTVEHELRDGAKPDAARYAARLRANRFAAAGTGLPGASARRAMRRDLGGRGLRGRLRALIAIPPGGPRF